MTTQNNDGLDILRLMRAGTDYKFQIKVREFAVEMRPLSSIELIGTAKHVVKVMAEGGRTPIEESLLSAMIKLEKASTPVGGTFPKLPVAVLEQMTADEIDNLYTQWLSECEKVNPSMDLMTEDELIVLVDSVKKSPLGINIALNSLSFRALANMSRHLIQRE